jgi:hypothetical protein
MTHSTPFKARREIEFGRPPFRKRLRAVLGGLSVMSIANLFLKPFVVRAAITRVIQETRTGSYKFRLTIGAVSRPNYGYIVYNAAVLAKRLNYARISVLEFGVAGGRGLLNLEYHVREVEKLLPIKIDIYGFDTGEGLPRPVDYRDLPYLWREGSFKMDFETLRARLTTAKLVLGNIVDTAKSFFREHDPAPIAAAIYDFDFYSSTTAALKMFDEDEKYFLPRIYCYFDDIIGSEDSLHNDYTGERLAISEFNQAHPYKKLSVAYHLLARKVVQPWYHQIFIYHDFRHSRYNDLVTAGNQQLPIE